MSFVELCKKGVVVLDGAMGTELQLRGLAIGESPESWNLSHPEIVREIHEAYFEAGADIAYTNTFGANPAKYHGAEPLRDVVAAAVANARAAAGRNRLVALDVGPTGRLLKPAGDFEFDAAYDAFAEQIRLGAEAGADFVAIETITDTYELKAAVLAARENCSLPVLATVALGEDGKLLTGAGVDAIAALFDALKVDACGFNCGLGPDRMLPFVRALAERVNVPIIVKANAGMPRVVDGKTSFNVDPEQFAADIAACVRAGARIVGGCCGTTSAHIRRVREATAGFVPDVSAPVRRSVVSSYSRAVELSLDDTIVIGERINPTGKKKLKEAYRSGDTGYVLREAVAQAQAGAQILDVNAGVPGIDESAVLRSTVEAVQSVCELPLQIDTSSPAALENALRHYNGKALVNSVNGKQQVMDEVFPVVAKYGGVVVALTLDENGIPPTAEGRLAIARKIIAEGAKYGLERCDFVIDVLCLAVSAEPDSVEVILESLRRVRSELGVLSVLGVSNISFGLPARPCLNAAFYALALGAGLSAAIVNPLCREMMATYRAYRALTGRDRNCSEWIEAAESLVPAATVAPANIAATVQSAPSGQDEPLGPLAGAIRHALKADSERIARELLAAGRSPIEIIDGEIVPALEIVGRGFETGKVFLPQLLMAAEAASAAFEIIRASLAQSGVETTARGPIVIATVKGDIHDIGKNIVRSLLENYGFRVIDLGRDVPPEKIVEAALRHQCRLVGLSALMTTTVPFMAETIKALNAADPAIRTFVGGAVLTADYAAEIGASYYAKDAMASVRIAEEFFK